MAVTKIRKISSWTLTASVIVGVIVVLAFFFGGSEAVGTYKSYKLTDLLLYWTYFMFIITVVVALAFAISGFFKAFKYNKKGAMISLSSVVLLVVVLAVTYAFGDSTPIQNLNQDSAKYNTAGWLKMSDMWLYTTYALGTLVILAIVWGAIRKSIQKK